MKTNVQNSESPYFIKGIKHGHSDNTTKIFKTTMGIK